MSNNSVQKTLLVALFLCVLCSIMVSTTAVVLRPMQKVNKRLDMKKNILSAAGLMQEGVPVEQQFEKIEALVVDLQTGKVARDIDPSKYDMRKEIKNPDKVVEIDQGMGAPGIKTRLKKRLVYIVKNDAGGVGQVILPIHGKGLWSTMYGFLALDEDTRTVKGFAFYEHGETPGLGGEVDNPKWKQQWIGKKVYDEDYKPILEIVKGAVDSSDPGAYHKVDGLSGATITSDGVENTITYWLSENGYGPFLKNVREGTYL